MEPCPITVIAICSWPVATVSSEPGVLETEAHVYEWLYPLRPTTFTRCWNLSDLHRSRRSEKHHGQDDRDFRNTMEKTELIRLKDPPKWTLLRVDNDLRSPFHYSRPLVYWFITITVAITTTDTTNTTTFPQTEEAVTVIMCAVAYAEN